MEHLSGILNTSTRVPDGTLPLPDNKGPRRGVSIEVSDLHFSYPNNRHVLRGLSVSIEPGESVAFVGPSGSGKSTLLRLVLRSYDPDRGTGECAWRHGSSHETVRHAISQGLLANVLSFRGCHVEPSAAHTCRGATLFCLALSMPPAVSPQCASTGSMPGICSRARCGT